MHACMHAPCRKFICRPHQGGCEAAQPVIARAYFEFHPHRDALLQSWTDDSTVWCLLPRDEDLHTCWKESVSSRTSRRAPAAACCRLAVEGSQPHPPNPLACCCSPCLTAFDGAPSAGAGSALLAFTLPAFPSSGGPSSLIAVLPLALDSCPGPPLLAGAPCLLLVGIIFFVGMLDTFAPIAAFSPGFAVVIEASDGLSSAMTGRFSAASASGLGSVTGMSPDGALSVDIVVRPGQG